VSFSGRSQLAEGFGELAAEPPVVLRELPVAFAGGLQPLPERWVGRTLAGGNPRCGCSPGRVSQLLDLVSYVGLGVEPRPGDSGGPGDQFAVSQTALYGLATDYTYVAKYTPGVGWNEIGGETDGITAGG